MSVARNYKEGVHPPFIDSTGGAQAGQVMVWDAPTSAGDAQAKLPTGTTPHLLAPAGINGTSGTVGGSGTTATDPIEMTRQGLTRVVVTAGDSVTRGQDGEADADTLGNVQGRTAYSRSGYSLGTFEESYSGSATSDQVEFYANPRLVELVRQVTGGTTSTFGANTRYLTPPGAALSSSQVALYIARFAGETIRNLWANLATAPGGTDTVVFTVMKSSDNGATWSDTTLTCTITGTAKSASDLTHAVTLAAGDLLCIKAVSNATTAAVATATFDVT